MKVTFTKTNDESYQFKIEFITYTYLKVKGKQAYM